MSARARLAAALGASALAALLPAGATASSVVGEIIGWDSKTPYEESSIHWTDDPGEASRLEVTRVGRGGLVLRDAAGPIRANGTCRALPDGAVWCELVPSAPFLQLDGGDGDDELRIRSAVNLVLSIDGGAGDDTIAADGGDQLYESKLLGSEGDDVIVGSDSRDRIVGGSGSDRIDAGGGSDLVIEDEQLFAPDLLDGGSGGDSLVYQRDEPVRVDLGAGVGGQPQGEDRLRGFEHVTGTVGDDVLIGDDGPNSFNFETSGVSGAAGFDRIDGRGGDDRFHDPVGLIACGAGEDRLAPPAAASGRRCATRTTRGSVRHVGRCCSDAARRARSPCG